MSPVLFYSGLTVSIAGAALPMVLPSLPQSLQISALTSTGTFIINNQNWIVLAGLLLILLSIFI